VPQAPAGAAVAAAVAWQCRGNPRSAALRPRDHQGSEVFQGLFTVHQIKERYFYEIPKKELGKDLLWNSQIAKTTLGAGYGGGSMSTKWSAGI
jgi:hypothetical protein